MATMESTFSTAEAHESNSHKVNNQQRTQTVVLKRRRGGRYNKKYRLDESAKTKLTKEERREKYTTLARQLQDRKRNKDVICFKCRKRGHSIVDCPDSTLDVASGSKKRPLHREAHPAVQAPICYKCGSTDHSLGACPKRSMDEKNGDESNVIGSLPFAKCFVCNDSGHIASQCPKNKHGIYVKGDGCCKECGSKFHRAANCPVKSSSHKKKQRGICCKETDDNSDLLEEGNGSTEKDEANPVRNRSSANATADLKTQHASKKRRVVKF